MKAGPQYITSPGSEGGTQLTAEGVEFVAKQTAGIQHIIAALLHENGRLRKVALDGPENSNTFLEGQIGAVDRPLGVRSLIKFTLPGHDEFHVRLDEAGDLEVYAYVSSRNKLAVLPGASNAVRIRLV